MPLWTIHHSPGVFTDAEKHELAGRITDHYEKAGLPRFYVITLFKETGTQDFYVGGEPAPMAIRVVIDHIARHSRDTVDRQRITRWIKNILTPLAATKPDLHWEFHVDETSEELWMINGLVPPPGGSDAEKTWAESNAVSVY
ncbi:MULTISPECIES: tautomerase family protein [Mycobacterium]|uniref:4-oxalocrotonate tautomerase n=1 Tax=Mycobacterium gordonae TaxID=1778 RepID=A0A1A6BMV6_MYCGO|nr:MULTISPECIES: tautomerase family protein [Mycobacterium]MBI2703064.1 tautomerase family protein [Mycobacterium sp.]MBX9981600.1 tautomerase family protein [Mycobacterium gordonae]MCQ4365856.1 tautomerase family protein [Mycobacterium gordonae]MCV7006743.1 tautomerase family protein [Mycobacterium gordonae]OBS03534.1 4-oxalocrotonate tautomerase [Mycobacterium gordonae]